MPSRIAITAPHLRACPPARTRPLLPRGAPNLPVRVVLRPTLPCAWCFVQMGTPRPAPCIERRDHAAIEERPTSCDLASRLRAQPSCHAVPSSRCLGGASHRGTRPRIALAAVVSFPSIAGSDCGYLAVRSGAKLYQLIRPPASLANPRPDGQVTMRSTDETSRVSAVLGLRQVPLANSDKALLRVIPNPLTAMVPVVAFTSAV